MQNKTNNLIDCVTTNNMTAQEAVTAICDLVSKYPGNRQLGIGIWEGEVVGTLSGDSYAGNHLGVFSKETLVALFGKHEDPESEAMAAIFVLAIQNAEKIAQALKSANNTCVWTPATNPPDSDTTVMVSCPDSNEPVCPAYHDGERWWNIDGTPLVTPPESWTNFPEPHQQ